MAGARANDIYAAPAFRPSHLVGYITGGIGIIEEKGITDAMSGENYPVTCCPGPNFNRGK